MATVCKNGPQSRGKGGAKNLMGSDGLSSPKSADLVRNSIGSAHDQRMRIGTWNVRTMQRKGKLENIKREMHMNGLSILGLSEVRWKESKDIISDGITIISTAAAKGQGGVTILLDGETAKRLMKIVQHSERLVLVKVQAEPVDLVIIQVYMPTSAHEDTEVEEIYEQLNDLIEEEKGSDNLVVMGDWNSVIGEGQDGKEVGAFGLGTRNERGERLVDFCQQRKMVIANTCFEHEKRRRYTWKKPGDTGRFQLDYILVRQRYRNSVKNACSYPGADADSDHNLVVLSQVVTLKKLGKRRKRLKWALENLDKGMESFQDKVCEKIKSNKREDDDIEGNWRTVKEAVLESAKSEIGYKKGITAKKPWVSEEMIKKMGERRRWKNATTEEGIRKYKQLNNELRRETDKAREEWWKGQCEDLEELDKKGRSDLMYNRVRQLTANRPKSRSSAIKNENGDLLTVKDDIKSRWKQYIEVLYDSEGKPLRENFAIEKECEVDDDCKGPELLDTEVTTAIRDLKNGKAVGVDGIPAEFWKNLGKEATSELVGLCKRIYEEGVWPEDFTKSVLIPLPKKMNATACGEFRTISLITHASKILLKVLNKRLEGKTRDYISKTQFGFVKGRGTRDAIGVMRMLCEKVLDHGKELYVCFVDYEKAFDRVNWVKMLDILKDLGVDWRDRKLICELYMKQEAVVRVMDEETDSCAVGRGVRQGCTLSPLLFSIYAERMMAEALDGINEGVNVGGELRKDVRFADDQIMAAETVGGLQKIMDNLNVVSQSYGMKINVKKTKVMVISRKRTGPVTVTLNGERIEQVVKFCYLGSWVTEDGRCDTEIKSRIAMAKTAFKRMKELLTKNMSLSVKKKIVKAVVWSVLLYGSETWTMKADMIHRIEAFEMWVWRRMEKIRWTERKTNAEVLKMVGEKRQLIERITRSKKRWIGHVTRGGGLLKEIIEGRIDGKRPRGRKRLGMISELTEDGYANMKRRTENRTLWRKWMPKRTCRKTDN